MTDNMKFAKGAILLSVINTFPNEYFAVMLIWKCLEILQRSSS